MWKTFLLSAFGAAIGAVISVATFAAVNLGGCTAQPAGPAGQTAGPAAPTPPADPLATWRQLFPDGLVDAAGNPMDMKCLQGKMVGIYLAAGWCPDCTPFTPKLVAFYGQHSADLEIVLVSRDRSLADQGKHMADAGMRWPAVPWQSPSAKTMIREFSAGGIPRLVVYSADGRLIAPMGHKDVEADANTALAKWKKAAAAAARNQGRHPISAAEMG
jgi:hypothetical protein